MQVHDELAALLAKNLTLSPTPVHVPEPAMSVVEQQAAQPKITYSISQHYNHSAHVTRPVTHESEQQEQQQQQQEQQEQQQQQQQMDTDAAQPDALAVEAQLRQYGIDPASLTHVQMALFRMSTPDRRDYLLQLWRICPPAKEADEDMSLDSNPVPEVPPTAQTVDGRWLQSSQNNYTEPYMWSGYEELARREYLASSSSMEGPSVPRSMDPVYNNRLETSSRASWPLQNPLSNMDMENQYGAMMAMRDGAMEL